MKFALWLTALLMIAPQFVEGAPDRVSTDKSSGTTVTSEELKRRPATSQKESPLLPCAGEIHRDRLQDLARLESSSDRDCPAEGAIKAQPIRPADPADPGRPLRFY